MVEPKDVQVRILSDPWYSDQVPISSLTNNSGEGSGVSTDQTVQGGSGDVMEGETDPDEVVEYVENGEDGRYKDDRNC